jgi:hypothetical protein
MQLHAYNQRICDQCRLVSGLDQFSAFDCPAMDNQFTAPNDSAIDYQLRYRSGFCSATLT